MRFPLGAVGGRGCFRRNICYTQKRTIKNLQMQLRSSGKIKEKNLFFSIWHIPYTWNFWKNGSCIFSYPIRLNNLEFWDVLGNIVPFCIRGSRHGWYAVSLLSTNHAFSFKLMNERKALHVFRDFVEAPINFPPTYKYQPGTSIYERREGQKKR